MGVTGLEPQYLRPFGLASIVVLTYILLLEVQERQIDGRFNGSDYFVVKTALEADTERKRQTAEKTASKFTSNQNADRPLLLLLLLLLYFMVFSGFQCFGRKESRMQFFFWSFSNAEYIKAKMAIRSAVFTAKQPLRRLIELFRSKKTQQGWLRPAIEDLYFCAKFSTV